MFLLELFPTVVGVFACDTFDRDGPGWRASVAEAMAERESEPVTPRRQTDDRLNERAELAGMMSIVQAVRRRLPGRTELCFDAGAEVAVLLG